MLISGRVTRSRDGVPLRGEVVAVYVRENDEQYDDRTDSDGCFSIGVPDRYTIHSMRAGGTSISGPYGSGMQIRL